METHSKISDRVSFAVLLRTTSSFHIAVTPGFPNIHPKPRKPKVHWAIEIKPCVCASLSLVLKGKFIVTNRWSFYPKEDFVILATTAKLGLISGGSVELRGLTYKCLAGDP
eukprot:snap_masked-scaffold_1-processed-gene-3.16-mRNA-1 protein AED:1.00 eAED:1.00 QI:0/0/0/0/1/1/2/0/110